MYQSYNDYLININQDVAAITDREYKQLIINISDPVHSLASRVKNSIDYTIEVWQDDQNYNTIY